MGKTISQRSFAENLLGTPKKPTSKKEPNVLDFIICKASQEDNRFFCYCNVQDSKKDELAQLESDHYPVQLDLSFKVQDEEVG
jgi:endonuclease/exonuclease/phosphatase family metal-dependent hydrolase